MNRFTATCVVVFGIFLGACGGSEDGQRIQANVSVGPDGSSVSSAEVETLKKNLGVDSIEMFDDQGNAVRVEEADGDSEARSSGGDSGRDTADLGCFICYCDPEGCICFPC